ncbi:sensor histidine kinase [Harryflintia acetispora]|uniref:sensor histidine kinase n=1 Tax=Harryflintia acetispora TaxID=1849041 RepID=UPI00189BF470|nr:HAMP domain-containing sensor histidine kinase [Harryflintia acetispora]
MDTKSKKWKAILSFLCFSLGVSLLLGGAAPFLSLALRGSQGVQELRESFETDYQNTVEFRRDISGYLEDFLAMASGSPLDWYGYPYDGEYTYSYAQESAEAAMEGLGLQWGWQTETSYGVSEDSSSGPSYPSDEEIEAAAKRAHERFAKDKNILYTISYNGKEKYTNAEGTGLDGPSLAQPEGYNFLLYFDGKKATIIKDGKKIDPYGDGYYREENDWYLPGYNNFTVDEKTSHATVTIAAAKVPMLYVSTDNSNSAYRSNDLYYLARNLSQNRQRYIVCAFALTAGAVFFLFYLFSRRQKARADRFLARITGRVYIEFKVLILLLALLFALLASSYNMRELAYYVYNEGYLDFWMLSSYLQDVAQNTGAVLFLFWVGYLLVNDLRYGVHPLKHSLLSRLRASHRRAELRLPFQQRMERRLRRITAFQVILSAAAAVPLFFFMIYNSPGALVIAIPLLLLLALGLWALHGFNRDCRSMSGDVGALIDQIGTVRAGNLSMPLTLPEDADLCQAAQDLGDIQRGMNAALEEQIRSERMKVELIANVSHDIKTPLTSIISYVELLDEEEDLPEHVRDYIEILKGKSQRLKTMVQDVFEVSKATSGQLPVDQEELDLGKLLRQTLADMQEQIAGSPVQLKSEIPEEPVMIQADGQRLYRVFQNLLQNALQYSLEGSRIHVSLHADGSMAVASVKNTSKTEIAPGVDFTERFVRGDQSRTDGGSGLGLSIARSFTEACGGRFSVETIADLFVVTVEFARLPE